MTLLSEIIYFQHEFPNHGTESDIKYIKKSQLFLIENFLTSFFSYKAGLLHKRVF